MSIDEVAPYLGYAVVATIIFVLGQLFGLLLGMELLHPNSQNPVIRLLARFARFLIGPDKRELLDAKPEIIDADPFVPGVVPPEAPIEAEGVRLPSFGKPVLEVFRHEDYEEWLVCCAGGERLTPDRQFYIIPVTNDPDDKFFALCLEHRELPTWKALSP